MAQAQGNINVNLNGDGNGNGNGNGNGDGNGVNQPPPVRRAMSDYIAPDLEERDSINIPGVEANNFEIKPAIIQMVASDQFGGSPMEDPNAHITKFLQICSTFKMNGVPTEAIKLRLFPFSVRDKAHGWLISFQANYFDSWVQLHREFLKKFYPISKTQRMRRAIQNFKQLPNESLAESWERFKDLRRQCPHHGIQSWDLMMAFYEGLFDTSRTLVDASSGGLFTVLEPIQAEELLEKIAMNGSTWYYDRSSQRLGGGIHEVEQISALSAKVYNVATMVQKLAQITLQNRNVSYVSTPSSPSRQVMICDLCGEGHNLGECLNDDTNSQSSVEHIDLVGYNRPQQSFQPQGAYNPNAPRNHPGFSWSNPNGATNPQSYGNRNSPPGFQGQQNFRGGQTQPFRPTQGF
ncbi:uncharacterized protein LOC116020158 [Ipomoea triloba]|uniref:uncharacterized protein LOC116020158 n=1 Tax=Ipomoea triloba TaxID=35885 RepID=UPI00125D8C9A|nr:uncharacterized protein LOC116020158 [Ipomoea triloba]